MDVNRETTKAFTMNPDIAIVNYRSHHQSDFERLNRQWIEKYFWMEPIDQEVLQNPESHILATGGHIFMAEFQNQVVGTVALKWVSNQQYEFTKMAVEEKFQGLKIGYTLAKEAIEFCRKQKVEQIILYSNTRLAPAIKLYQKLGFYEVTLDGPYKRSNIKMQLDLNLSPA